LNFSDYVFLYGFGFQTSGDFPKEYGEFKILHTTRKRIRDEQGRFEMAEEQISIPQGSCKERSNTLKEQEEVREKGHLSSLMNLHDEDDKLIEEKKAAKELVRDQYFANLTCPIENDSSWNDTIEGDYYSDTF